MKIESIQVGMPAAYCRGEQSAINKQVVHGPVQVSQNNLAGDQQADLTVHGGRDKAVYVYPHEHYTYWRQRVGLFKRPRIKLPENPAGSFGENLTLSGLTEENVYIGDTFTCGDVVMQVTQAREPCWKLAYKFKQKKLVLWVITSGYTGGYLRVLKEGQISAGMPLTRIEQGCQDWSVLQCNQLYHSNRLNRDKLESILACQGLSKSWRRSFSKRLEYVDKHTPSA